MSLISRLTGSRAALVIDLEALGLASEPTETCAHWLAAAWFEGDESEAMTGGSAVHHALACVAKHVEHAPPGGDLRAMYAFGRAWLATHRGVGIGLRAEVAFAYDAETGAARELEDPRGEDLRWYADPAKRALYGVRDSEVCMRLDLVGPAFDDEGPFVAVYDYKCHFGPDDTDARAQLALGALAAAKAYGFDRARGAAIHLRADREAFEDPIELRSPAFDALAWQLEALAATPSSPAPAPNPGPWCGDRYCPAAATCSATMKVVASARALLPADRLVRPLRPFDADATTNDEAAWDLVEIDLLEAALEAKRARAKAAADRMGGIVRADGKVYSGEVQPTEKPDLTQAGAVEVLEELGLDFAVSQVTSWAAMTEVASQKKADEAREALRAIGALKTTTPRVYKARVPKRATNARKAS